MLANVENLTHLSIMKKAEVSICVGTSILPTLPLKLKHEKSGKNVESIEIMMIKRKIGLRLMNYVYLK